MELLIHPTSRSNQPTFKVYNVKGYKYIGTYSIEVEFSNGDKETFYAIDSVEAIGSEPKFELHSQYYYISNGFIKDFIGLSPSDAEILAGIYKVYSDWNEAYKALEEYNKIFTTFKE